MSERAEARDFFSQYYSFLLRFRIVELNSRFERIHSASMVHHSYDFPTAHLRFYTAHAYASFGIYIIFKNSIITRTFTMQKSILKWRLSIFRAPDALLIYTVKQCLLWKCANYETPRCVKRLRLCVSIWWEEKRSGFHKIHLRCTKAQWNIAKIIYFIFNVFAISRFAFESMGINRCSFCAE